MSVLVGTALAAGVLLALAPWLWPRRIGEGAPAPGARPSRALRLAEDAGLPGLRPRTMAVSCVGSGALAGAAASLIGVPVLALCALVVGAAAPLAWLCARRGRLVRARRGLWPDVCDHLIAAVRSGAGLPDAVASLGATAPEPLRPAFAAFARDMSASGHFDSSAERLKANLADPVADRILETLRMARQVGGTELTAVLRSLGESVRAEAHLRAEVEARQSWIRGAAMLGVIAPWIILALLSLRPEGARAYASAEGVALVLVGGAVSLLAYRLMIRIGRLPEPRRWFA